MLDMHELEKNLSRAMLSMGVVQDPERIDKLINFLRLLQHWNKAYNLTAIREPEQMLIQHVFDSLAVVPHLLSLCAHWQSIDSNRNGTVNIVDVGSGAGLPGIVIAICQPQYVVHCVDAVGKKTAFIRHAAGVLGLSNLRAVHARIEALDSMHANVVISRAFASLLDFVTLAAKHCMPDGFMLAMKGQVPHQEQVELEAKTQWCVAQTILLEVPQLDAQRCLLQLKHRP